MKMRPLGFLIGVITFLFMVKRVRADFLESETEPRGFETLFFDGGPVNRCPFDCGDYCKENGGVKLQCTNNAGEYFQRCQCEKTIPVTKPTCLSYESKCYKANFIPVHRDSKCYCTCDNNHCDDVCNKSNNQLGKCKPENKQKLSENTCECYCKEDECERKRGSFFTKASCNSRGKCITACNGTQEGLPTWCKLAADKCACYCNESYCQQYCINEKKKQFGKCVYRGCHCKETPFQDSECTVYCQQRTGVAVKPKQLPSKTGLCECAYNKINVISCYQKCERSSTCSVNDPCFCKDDSRAISKPKAEQTPCSGKLCWSEPTFDSEPKNASLQWVFASTRIESDIDFKWVVCRNSYKGFGIARMKKLGARISTNSDKTSDCLLIQYLGKGKATFDSAVVYHGLIGQRCGFKTMKKGDKIPKEAFEIVGSETLVYRNHFYFGRDKANNIYGAINMEGTMAGGNPDVEEWKTQTAVFPETFEILICT